MNDGILQFKPKSSPPRPLASIKETFMSLAANYVSVYDEKGKAGLACHLMATGFEKCIVCKTEDKTIKFAAIENCEFTGCPLHEFTPSWRPA